VAQVKRRPETSPGRGRVGAGEGSGAPVRGSRPDQTSCSPGASLSANSVITRVVTVAGGRFGPGHLGELTQVVPFEMVDAVLGETRAVQARVRDLPSRVVVYVRHEALRCIPDSVGRNSEGCSWV